MYKDVILWHLQLKGVGNEAVKKQSFVLLKSSWHKFRLECYNFRMINVTPMATKKKIAIKYAQKGIRKKLKHYTTKKIN